MKTHKPDHEPDSEKFRNAAVALDNYMQEHDVDAVAELFVVNETLKAAREHGLEAEVVWSAMKIYGDRFKTLPLDVCLQAALDEWDI